MIKDLLIFKEREEVKSKTKKSIPLILSGILIFSSIAYTPVKAKADTPAISDNGTTYVTVHIHRELTADQYQKIKASGGDPSHFTDNTFSIDDLIKAGAVIPDGERIVSAEVTSSSNGQARVMSTSDSGLTIGTWGGDVEPDMNDLQFSWAHIEHYYNYMADSSTLIGQDNGLQQPRTLGYDQLFMQITNPPGINSILKNYAQNPENPSITIDGANSDSDKAGWQVATFDAPNIDQAKTSTTYKKDGIPAILLNPEISSPAGYFSDYNKYFVNDAPPVWSNTEGSDNVNYDSWVQQVGDEFYFGQNKQISNMKVYPQFDFYLMTEGETAASRYDTNYAALYFPLYKESDGKYLYLGDPNSNNVPKDLIGHDYNNWIPTTLADQISPLTGSKYDLRRDPNTGMYYQVQPKGQWGSNGWHFLRYLYDVTTGKYIDLSSIKRPDGSSPQIIYGPDGKPNVQIIGASYILLPPQYKGHKIKAFVYNTDVGFDFGIDVRVMKSNKYIFDTDVTLKITYANGNGLLITKTVDRPFIDIGESDYYQVTVKNTSDKPVDNVVVTDQMPQGLKYVSIIASYGIYDNVTGTWMIGTLGPGQSAVLTANVIATKEGAYVNSAAVNGKTASATIYVGNYLPTGNLTVSNIHTIGPEGDTTTIPTSELLDVVVDTKSLFQFHGIANVRLYINGNLYKEKTLSYDPFEEKEVDFGKIPFSGGEIISASIDYNNSLYQGDNDGSKYGELFHDTDNNRLLKETQYTDNVIHKQIQGPRKGTATYGKLTVDFKYQGTTINPINKMDEAMVGDNISTINLSSDTNWVYDTYVIEDLYHMVANPHPWGTHREPPLTHKVLIKPEKATYKDNFNWYLPTSPYSGGPINSNTISFTALKLTSIPKTGTHQYWHNYFWWNTVTKSYVNSWWEAEGDPPTPVIVRSDPIYYEDLGNPEYFSTGRINDSISWGEVDPMPVASKRYEDDHYEESFESYSYDLWTTLTDWDYYKNQKYWSYIPQNFGIAQKPVRIYYNNKPVAYFNIIGDVNGNNEDNKLRLQDLSYDPDYDPIISWIWRVDNQTFTDKASAENYLNTVVVNQPGYHTIGLKVIDDPTGRYYRLTGKESIEYIKTIYIHSKDNSGPVSYKAQITFDRDVVYTKWHPTVERLYTPWTGHQSYVKVHVKVTDIGYWTYEYGVNKEKILRFVPLKVTDIEKPITNIVRYKGMGHENVTPVYFNVTKQTNNSFEYDAIFMYDKAGQVDLNDVYFADKYINNGIDPITDKSTSDSKMIFPFKVQYYGEVKSLVKDHVAVNAFNPTYANPPGPDETVFVRIYDLGLSRVDHYIMKDGKLSLTEKPDPLMHPIPYIGRTDTNGKTLEYDVDHQVYPY